MALYTADAKNDADAENTSGNVSPAPAFQTQAVSFLPRLHLVTLTSFADPLSLPLCQCPEHSPVLSHSVVYSPELFPQQPHAHCHAYCMLDMRYS